MFATASRDRGGGRTDRIAAKLLRDLRERGVRPVGIKLHRPAEERLRPDRATHHMCVRDRRFHAAASIACRPRIRPGTARPDAQHAAIVDPHQAAATRPDRNNVEHRRSYRQPVDLGFSRNRWFAILHQTDVGGRAAHVERDQIAAARSSCLTDRANDTRGRSAEQRGDRVAAHCRGGQSPTIRLHHAEVPSEPVFTKPGLEAIEIAVDDRLHIGRQQRRAGAFELPEFARNLV